MGEKKEVKTDKSDAREDTPRVVKKKNSKEDTLSVYAQKGHENLQAGPDKSFEKISTGDKPDFIKWFSELNKDSGPVAGGKGANLAEIFNLKIAVPPGFVVTAQAYDYFLEKAGIKKKIHDLAGGINYEDTAQLNKITEEIRKIVETSKMPKEMEEEIIESYEHLDAPDLNKMQRGSALDILRNSAESIFVAVRSSATTEDLADASFAGQQDTYLNIKGKEELIKHVKKCFASLFTSRATYYRNKKGFKHEEAHLAVVVQKMIDSEKSGVIFSKDPAYKNDNVIIEAVWGLGEGIVSGKINPDRYFVSNSLEILDRKIADKKIALTRDSNGGGKVEKLREEKSKHNVLENHEIKKLADIALKLEEHYQKPQDIEFATEGGEIFIVQTRPITTIEKRIEEGSGQKLQGEVILEGLAASPGIGSGKVKIIDDLKDLHKIKEGDVLVTKMTNPDMVVTMQKSIAIVTDDGGMTAHAAIVSREMGIPAIVGTHEATTKLKEDEIVTVDGYTGKVYKGKVGESEKKKIELVTAKTKTEIKVIVDLPSFAERASKTGLKKVGLTRIEGIIAESGKHPDYFLQNKKIKDYEDVIFKGLSGIANYFDEMWVRTSDIRTDEFANLEGAPKEKEANPMLGMHGIRYSLRNPEVLKAELNAMKRITEKGKKMGILMPQLITVEELKGVKKIIKEIGFDNLILGIMIETPAAVQIISELCQEGIKFISFGTNDLTQYILALDRGNPKVQEMYNEMHPAVLKQMEYVIRTCKKYGVESSICGQAGSRKEMAKFLVEAGIDSISVNADMAKEISDYVAEVEKDFLGKKGELPRQYQPEKKNFNKDNWKNKKFNKFKDKFKKKENNPQGSQAKQNQEKYYQNNKEKIDKDVQAIEKEKQEYVKKGGS
jgi:pyruvate, water dikinase